MTDTEPKPEAKPFTTEQEVINELRKLQNQDPSIQLLDANSITDIPITALLNETRWVDTEEAMQILAANNYIRVVPTIEGEVKILQMLGVSVENTITEIQQKIFRLESGLISEFGEIFTRMGTANNNEIRSRIYM